MTFVPIVSHGGSSVYEIGRLQKQLTGRGVRVEICHPKLFGISMDATSALTYAGARFPVPKVVLARTGSGTGFHAATALRQMENMGATVINSLRAIHAAMDKVYTMQIAAAEGLPIPRTKIFTADSDPIAEWTGGYPCIAKLATGSHGNGVFKCDDVGQLKAFVGLLKALDRKRPFLIQEYLGDRPGCDLRVLVIGGKAVGAMMRSSNDGDFRANISAGGVGANFDMVPEITDIAERITTALGLEIAGVDLLFSGNGFVLCEANSSPGFRGFETYCGLDVADLIAEYVVTKLTRNPPKAA